MMGRALLFLMATAAQLALLWLATSGGDALGGTARRLQRVRQRHALSDRPTHPDAQLRRLTTTGATQATAPTAPVARMAISIAAAITGRLHRAGNGWSLRRYGVVGHLIARRRRAFITKLPEAIELLVCGLRSGLPVSETLGLVTNEVPGPVGQEFKLVTERVRIGRSMEDALIESAQRLGLPEFNFFCITLAIHRETGGNLTETLVNLADVLRRRAQMTLKIRALSSESRASAMILGALPIGAVVMAQMVSFDI